MKSWICTTLSNLWAPMQGAARLYAFEKQEGHDIALRDFNQDAFFALLSDAFLAETVERLSYHAETAKRTPSLRENLGSILVNSSGGYLPRVLDPEGRHGIDGGNLFFAVLQEAPALLAAIGAAVKTVDHRFLALPRETFLECYKMMCCGKALIDALYFPAQLDFGFGLHGTAVSPTADSICRFRDDVERNFLIPYFANMVLPRFEAEAPDVVGISVSHAADIAPALTLARLLKRRRRDIHICLGGTVLTELAYKIVQNPPLLDDVDSAILGPGEAAFSDLLEHLDTGKALRGVPNLLYKKDDTLVESDRKEEFDLNRACTPEYAGLRPRPVVPLETSAGCYYGKCIFCYYPKMGAADIQAPCPASARTRSLEKALEDIHVLTERYTPSFIALTDSALSPERLDALCAENRKRGTPVRLGGFIRFEKAFRSEQRCRDLADGGFIGGQAGLESGCQRTNDRIHKGVRLEDVPPILHNLHRVGISVHLYAMVGIPGETPAEAETTLRFIQDHRELFPLDWQLYSFYAMEHGPLAARAASLGMTLTPYPPDVLVQIARYTVESGCSEQESLALSIRYEEALRPLRHPLSRIMDIESYKIFLLAQKALEDAASPPGIAP